MTSEHLLARFAELCREDLPSPGSGNTAARHRRIFEAGREDLSLAKLAEAHWDAVAILREAGREPVAGARYAVWASEIPGRELQLNDVSTGSTITGTKEFCSGAGLVDRALLTAGPQGSCMVEVDLRALPDRIDTDSDGWRVDAFRLTQTSALTFREYPVAAVHRRGELVRRAARLLAGCVRPCCSLGGRSCGPGRLRHDHPPRRCAHRGPPRRHAGECVGHRVPAAGCG